MLNSQMIVLMHTLALHPYGKYLLNLSCRLVENILQKKSWKNITDLIKLIPGP
jgi:hypothetical protein